jgi:hypothetical protein
MAVEPEDGGKLAHGRLQSISDVMVCLRFLARRGQALIAMARRGFECSAVPRLRPVSFEVDAFAHHEACVAALVARHGVGRTILTIKQN